MLKLGQIKRQMRWRRSKRLKKFESFIRSKLCAFGTLRRFRDNSTIYIQMSSFKYQIAQ